MSDSGYLKHSSHKELRYRGVEMMKVGSSSKITESQLEVASAGLVRGRDMILNKIEILKLSLSKIKRKKNFYRENFILNV